ncbi:hypothetical protein ACE6H2_022879 [Prunus campanulata]
MCGAEILGMFVHILGHGIGNRLAQERFQHSGETVSRYFGKLLDIVCLMAIDIIKPLDPEFKGVLEEILRDSRYMPHFKKWSILRDMPNYPFDKQVKIVIATMALHNYIRRHAQCDIHFDKVNDNPIAMEMEDDAQEEYHITQGPGAQELETLRNKIAASLTHASS